ncbi:type III secretion system chaperone [Belnapia sp. T18]|uniref:Type III secretion system chaperone n=1 Tax=Belnapia arida TaxID=2804533 RepID=A0ABS1U5V7_9PROT|nr:type III secretion system chaperone [Belnapia arida]MBL6080052.1 type III secretion system chaperone [Belnapia arida]
MAQGGRKQAETLLGELAALLDTPELAFDSLGIARMAVDDVLVEIEYAEDGERLLLLSPLGKFETPAAEDYGRLLDANFYGLGTADATIAREPATGLVVLQRQLALAGLDLPAFEATVGSFVSTAEMLTDRFATEGSRVGTPLPSAPQSDGRHQIRG